jgi:hypothetical protein
VNTRFVKIVTAAVVLAVLTIGAALALAEDAPAPADAKKAAHAYVGSKACKMCHTGQSKGAIWEKWLATKHANSLAALDSAKGENKDPKCLKCHTTGYGKDTGFDKVAEKQGVQDLGSVGCEACHGPGADYKAMATMKSKDAAIAAGLVVPKEELCKTCHNSESPTFKGFDFAKMYAQIEHHVPKAETPAK